MPDIPASALAAAALAIHRAACPLRDDPDHDCARDAAGEEMFIPRARAALEAAAPLLAEALQRKLMEHVNHPDSCGFCSRLGEGAAAAVRVQRIDRRCGVEHAADLLASSPVPPEGEEPDG